MIINADKVRLTGKKMDEKEYQRYSLHPGGQTREVASRRWPASLAMVEIAVRGMLPKNRLGRHLFNNLHVVAGTALTRRSETSQVRPEYH